MDTFVRYSREQMDFVLEGSEEFVRTSLSEFVTPLQAACGLSDAEPDDGPLTLKRWYGRTVPPGRNPTMQDHILIFAYYLNKVRRQFVFTPDDMKASFEEVGREIPKSLLQIMGSLKRDHNLLWPGDKRGEYCLLPAAIRHVEKVLALEPTVGEETPPKPAETPRATPKTTPNPPSRPARPSGVPHTPGKAKFENLFRTETSRDEES